MSTHDRIPEIARLIEAVDATCPEVRCDGRGTRKYARWKDRACVWPGHAAARALAAGAVSEFAERVAGRQRLALFSAAADGGSLSAKQAAMVVERVIRDAAKGGDGG